MPPSDKLIARVQECLDKRAKKWKERKLTGRYEYLCLDAAWVKDIVGVSASRICILTVIRPVWAVGITEDGESYDPYGKQLLGFERAQRESESSWRGFLSRLVQRGLDPRLLRLVISDEHRGIQPAISEVLGDVPYQLCWAHRVRSVREPRVIRADSLWCLPMVEQAMEGQEHLA